MEVYPAPEASDDFTAQIDQSRTELDGTAVLWCESDQLTIFTKTAHNRQYKVKSIENGNRTATFGYVAYTGTDATAITSNYAVYPYDAAATLSGEVITTKINATQVYDATKVDLANALMVAKSNNQTLSFVNAGALLRFKVSKENVPDVYTLESIRVASAANALAGEVTIDLAADSKAVVAATGEKEVLLSGIDTEITTEAKMFYMALPATNFAAGDLTVTFTFAEGEKVVTMPAFELKQNAIKSIAYTIKADDDFTGETPDYANVVTDIDALNAAIAAGDPVIRLAPGTYEGLVTVVNKSGVTLVADGDATIKGMLWVDTCQATFKGINFTNPDGVQFPNPSNSKYYKEINDKYPLVGAYNNANVRFEECTFDLVGPTTYGYYGYSHDTPAFVGCTFNCNHIRPIANNGDSILVDGCTFNDQYHYAVRIYENAEERQTVTFTNNVINGTPAAGKADFEGINISKKGGTATVYGDFTIKGNTPVAYRHHNQVTMDAGCTYDSDIAGFAFEREQ